MERNITHPKAEAAHHSAPAPENPIFYYNNHITDNQLKTALWVSVAAGVVFLLIFGIARKWVPTYKLRLSMPNVWIKPPPLPEGGIQQLWSWLYPVFMTSDAELMRTAGLDSLMLCWTATLGIQIFLPLTVIGMAVLLPINLHGRRVGYQGDVSQGTIAFQRLTLSNLERGAATYWVACIFVYAVTGYVCFLLLKYYQAYAILRQRYMTGGEAMINQWTNRICKGDACKPSEDKGRTDSGMRAWNAFRELVDVSAQMGHLANSMSQEEVSLRNKYEAPLTIAAMQRCGSLGRPAGDVRLRSGNSGRRSQPELAAMHRTNFESGIARASAPGAVPANREGHEKGFAGSRTTSLEDISLKSLAPGSRDPDSAALRAQLRKGQQKGASLIVTPLWEDGQGIEEDGKHSSVRSSYMDKADEEEAIPSGQAMSWHARSTSAGNVRWSGCRSCGAHLSSPFNASAGDMTAMPISRYETTYPNSAAPAQVQPWWAYEAEGESDGSCRQLAGKPSVFFRKTVNTRTAAGSDVAANAQQYAVLVMDVPDLRPRPEGQKKRSRAQQELKQLWARAKAFLYPRVKHYKSRQQKAAEVESKGLKGGQVIDADTPKGEDHEVVIHMTDPSGKVEKQRVVVSSDKMNVPKAGSDLEMALGTMASMQATTEDEWHEEVAQLSPKQLVEATFQRLFPDSFLYVLPVWKHKAVDELLWAWDATYGKLQAAEAAYEATGCKKRPTHYLKRWRCRGEVDSIDFWAARVHELESAIAKEQQKIICGPSTPSYFAFFSTQKDAAFAAQTRIHPEDSHCFRVMEAPGPEEVNWQALWKPRWERSLREVLVFPLIILIMLVPLGLFTGTLAQATSAICGGADPGRRRWLSALHTSWYCEDSSLIRPLITSLVPSLLLTIWQSLIMPIALYSMAQMEGKSVSCSALDRRISGLFFSWGVFNVFLGAMLGGSVFSKIRLIVNDPSATPLILGSALTTSSNFFINYVIIQAFAIMPLRLVFPYFGVITDLLQCCGLCRPRSEREKVMGMSALSVGYGREVGLIMIIYIMAFAYAASSPIILPFTLCYFTAAWVMWRYTILYVTERCYESGGRAWDQVFQNVCWCLFICIFFTGCVFLANSAFIQTCVMWVTLIPLLYKFNRYAKTRYGAAVAHMPLETAQTAPEAKVDPSVYMPPELRQGAAGWYPEYGKPWENCWGEIIHPAKSLQVSPCCGCQHMSSKGVLPCIISKAVDKTEQHSHLSTALQ